MGSTAQAVGGTIFGTVGALEQGKQTSDLLDNQAQTQWQNAAQARIAAKYNADRGSLMANKHLGYMQTGYAASGVDLTSGSVLDVMAASAGNAEMDRQNILKGGELRAAAYNNQAALDELGAKHALQASYFNALSSLMMGGGKMGSSMGGGGGGDGGSTEAMDQGYDEVNGGEGESEMMDAEGGEADYEAFV